MAETHDTIKGLPAEMLGARTEFPFVYLMGEPDTPEVIDPKTKRIIEPRKINIRPVTVKELACRLKAAHKREHEALEFIAHYNDNEAQMDDPCCADGHILAGKAKEALGIKEKEGGAK